MSDPPKTPMDGDEEEEEQIEKPKVDITLRELPEADIFEVPNFDNADVNNKIIEMQTELKLKIKNRKDLDAQYIACNNLGTAYYRLFKFDKAEICNHMHLMLAKPITNALPFQEKRDGNKREERIALVNLGCIFQCKREFELALQTFKEAHDIAVEQEDKRSQARIMNNMANVYEQNCDFESALECQSTRLQLVADLADVNAQIKCATAIASLYQLQGEIRDSLSYYEKAVINLRMKIVKSQLDALEDPEKVEESAEFYDRGVA